MGRRPRPDATGRAAGSTWPPSGSGATPGRLRRRRKAPSHRHRTGDKQPSALPETGNDDPVGTRTETAPRTPSAGPRGRTQGFLVYRPESAPKPTPGDRHESVGGLQKSKYDPVRKSARKTLDRQGLEGPLAAGNARCPEARDGGPQTAETGPVRRSRTGRNRSRRPRPGQRHPRTGRRGRRPAAHRTG